MNKQLNDTKQAELLAGVLDSALDGIYAFQPERDESGQIVDFIFVVVNRAAEQLVGRTAQQLLGQRMLKMLPGNKTDGLFDAYVQVVETGNPFVTEHYYAHDGLANWYSISATPYGDGFTVSFADITARKTSEERLRIANERFELLVAGNASGVWDWDCKSDDVYWSPQFRKLIGYGDDEGDPVLQDFVSRLHPQDKDRTLAMLQRHIDRQGPYDIEYRLRHKDGHYVWCHAAGQAQWDEQNNPVRMAGSISDISKRKANERLFNEQKHRLEFALQASRTGLWDWFVIEGSVYYSDNWYTMLGYEPGELPMDFVTWESLAHPEDLPRAKAAIDQYMAGQTPRYTCEMRLRNKAGNWQWIQTFGEAAERADDGQIIRIVGLHLDIHKQKIAQQELEQARDQAQLANTAKSAFLANMSHEIRTPMNAILGYADLLLDGGQTQADKRNHAQTIRRNGKHLMSILNDILDLSKIEAGKLSIEQVTCTPTELFEDVINLMAPKAGRKDIALTFKPNSELPSCLKCDPTRIRQVLINLIGNAIKFTHQGEVGLAVRIDPSDDGSAVLTCEVSDTGIGIGPEQMDQLFKPFSQADESTTRKYGGTGLGLSISSNLCNMLDGKLTCTSTPGQGSTFTATFRIQPMQACPTKTSQSTTNTGTSAADEFKGKRVLIIEDGPDNQRLFKHYITKAGATVELAENGAVGKDTALAAWKAGQPFDIVLMDMQMPVLDGYDATSQLREAGYDLPIIALTAHASSNDRDKCLAAGCTDYLSKPIDRIKLIQTIAGYLSKSRQQGVGI